jgi:hypothetical protein
MAYVEQVVHHAKQPIAALMGYGDHLLRLLRKTRVALNCRQTHQNGGQRLAEIVHDAAREQVLETIQLGEFLVLMEHCPKD